MNVTRDVITDLWSVCASGEASADTRALVSAFLEQDPELAQVLTTAEMGSAIFSSARPLPPDAEARALRKTKRILHGWDWLLFCAILFTCTAFGRIVSDTSFDVSPRNFIIAASIAVLFWIAFVVRMLWVRRRVYRIRG
jgi:hypothetical protein